eukprot:CCRYP_003580-RA/>CCRYP_003580-RA protein AED:0.36 eAED:0.36 QI:62/1/1/1/0.66/0.5/4/1099/612
MMKSAAKQRRRDLRALPLLLLLKTLSNVSSFSLPTNSLSHYYSPIQTPHTPLEDSSRIIKQCRGKPCPPRILRPHHHLYSSINGNEPINDNDNERSTKSTKRRLTKPKPKNLYAILGADPSMSKSEIKRLYLALAKQTHPDSPNYAAASSSDFSEIASAYKTLTDDKLRKRYDRELAAEEFKDDIVAMAAEVAKEYGPSARKFYEDWALPFLKRTTASTVAISRVVSEVASDKTNGGGDIDSSGDVVERTRIMGSRRGTAIEKGATLSEVMNEMSEMERSGSGSGSRAFEDFGRAFQRVIEAGRNATRQIDGIELQEKSVELRMRADEARAESLAVLEQLSAIKSERLSLTFHTSSANFSSSEALQFLDGFNTVDEVGIVGRMTFRNTIRQDIEMFSSAEEECERKMQAKAEVDAQAMARMEELKNAEQNARDAILAETEARKMLEEAQKRVVEFQARVTEAQRAVSSMNISVKRAEQEYEKSNLQLKRKRDVVRKALRRKDDDEGESLSTFDRGENGSVRLNSAFDKSASSSMNDMGFESQNMAKIEKLKKQEASIESEFLRLVEKASRLVSRSERLRLRSEELIGKQNDNDVEQLSQDLNRGSVVGETML